MKSDRRHTESIAPWALVTGASGGIGRELALLLAKRGFAVVLVARNGERLADVAARIEADAGVKTLVVAADLSEPGAARRVVAAVDAAGAHIEVLANNAGFGIAEPFVGSSWERQRELLRTNIEAVAELSHVFGRRMAQARRGAVLNVASVAAFMPGPYMGTYYASKAFVQSFTQALHTELRPYGVHVTSLCPGPVRTSFFSSAGFGPKSPFRIIALPAGYVACVGLAALRMNKAQVSPGLLAKLIVVFCRIAPRGLLRAATSALQKPTACRQSCDRGCR